MEQFSQAFQHSGKTAAQAFVYIAVAMLIIWLAKSVFDALTFYDDDDQIEIRSNVAVGIRRAGLYLGLVLGMVGTIIGPGTPDFWLDVGSFAIDGVILVAMMLVAYSVANRLIMPRVDNNAQIKDGNVAVGWVEFGTYVALGLISLASFSGEGGGWLNAIVFAALGLVALVVMYHFYKATAKFDVVTEINFGNNAAGLYLASRLVALGVILAASLSGPSGGWVQDITSFTLFSFFGVVLLALVNYVTDVLFLPQTRLEVQVGRKNIAAIMLVAGLQVAAAIIVAAATI